MVKVLFVVRGYAPDISASGNLIRPIIEFAAKDKNIKISILCISKDTREEIVDGVKIIRLAPNKYSRKGRVFNRINRQLNINYFDRKIVNALEKKIENLDIIESYDAIISASYEEAIALSNANISKEKKYHFQLEKFPISTSLKIPLIYRKKIENKEKMEKRILNSMSMVFCLPIVFEYYRKKEYSNIIEVEHPMIVEATCEMESNKMINKLIYGGGLDRNQRNPMKLLQLLRRVSMTIPIQLNFYSYSNMNDQLLKFENENNFFKSNNPISKEEFLNGMLSSDFIITIGNKENDIFPSKIFDCISTGRPIIHVSQNNMDPYYKYLDKYKYYLILKYDELLEEGAVEKSINFIKKNKNKKMDFKDIKEIYKECTPEYVWNQLIGEIGNYGYDQK